MAAPGLRGASLLREVLTAYGCGDIVHIVECALEEAQLAHDDLCGLLEQGKQEEVAAALRDVWPDTTLTLEDLVGRLGPFRVRKPAERSRGGSKGK